MGPRGLRSMKKRATASSVLQRLAAAALIATFAACGGGGSGGSGGSGGQAGSVSGKGGGAGTSASGSGGGAGTSASGSGGSAGGALTGAGGGAGSSVTGTGGGAGSSVAGAGGGGGVERGRRRRGWRRDHLRWQRPGLLRGQHLQQRRLLHRRPMYRLRDDLHGQQHEWDVHRRLLPQREHAVWSRHPDLLRRERRRRGRNLHRARRALFDGDVRVLRRRRSDLLRRRRG